MQENSSNKRIVDDYELTFSYDWTQKLEPWQHWIYYWYQASLVWNYVDKNKKILEVGIGTGFLKNYLKNRGWEYCTIDIDKRKSPDIVDDISSIDLSKLAFECVLAFEVFEHLPYPLFERAIHNIAQKGPSHIIFSLPWSISCFFEFKIKLPKLKEKKIAFYIKKRKVTCPNHFWELKKSGKNNARVIYQGDKGLVSINKINELFSSVGYILKTEQKVDNIQFFVAKKSCKLEDR